jgi:hypothetical protein
LLTVKLLLAASLLSTLEAAAGILLLQLADLPGNLLGLLLGFLAFLALALQGLFHPLLDFTLLETLLFQLLNLALFQPGLLQ